MTGDKRVLEDINISYNSDLHQYVIDAMYRVTDSEGNVDIMSITDLPITIRDYPEVNHYSSGFGGCFDTTVIDLGFGDLFAHPTMTKIEKRRIHIAEKEMTLEEIEKKLGYKIKIVSDKEKNDENTKI